MRYSKYEIARMIGARALQLAHGAPLRIELTKDDFERIRYNPIEIAKMELEKGVIPIKIKRDHKKPQEQIIIPQDTTTPQESVINEEKNTPD